MRTKLIDPFLNSINRAMETMLCVSPEYYAPYPKKEIVLSGDVSGIINFRERSCCGGVVLSFPEVTALKMYNMLTGESIARIDNDVCDAVGEMANMVAGGAKSQFSQVGLPFKLGIPTVVLGNGAEIDQIAEPPIIVVPMSLSGNSFSMEICMKILDHRQNRSTI